MENKQEVYLNIDDPLLIDESVEKYENFEYMPQTLANLNQQGSIISITVNNKDAWYHLHESYLFVKGKLVKDADDTVYADADMISITNNGIVGLFSRAELMINNQIIESIGSPLQAITITKLIQNNPCDNDLAQLWSLDKTIAAAAPNTGFALRHRYLINNLAGNNKGCFTTLIPLKDIFGFIENYDKVLYGMQLDLKLNRTSNDDAIFKINTLGDVGKITLDRISWIIPHVSPSLLAQNILYNIIQNESRIHAGFLSRQCESTPVNETTKFDWNLVVASGNQKPRYIIVGFQTGRSGNQDANAACFDQCNLKNAFITLNGIRYPNMDVNNNYATNEVTILYEMYVKSQKQLYGPSSIPLPLELFILNYPLLVFDISKQPERIKNSPIDIRLQCEFHANVAADTRAYALILSDKIVSFQSDGNKMNILF
jgi:hypothetical protein